MDLAGLKISGKRFIDKYKYALLVLLLGIVLMVLPSRKESGDVTPSKVEEIKEQSVDSALAQMLSMISGVGKTEVFLTVATGEVIQYQTDEHITTSDTAGNTQSTTVTVTDSEHNQVGLIRQVNPPTYLGAIVVCQGADSPSVRYAVIDAVSKVTGLGTDRISVMKMK